MAFSKVTLVGGNGTLGPFVLQALLDADFEVTVISRSSSASRYSSKVHDVRVSDDMPKSELVKALQGQDALIITITGFLYDETIKLADAAFEAGVKRVIPPDFGSCDSADQHSIDLIPLYATKKKVRDHLIRLSEKSNGSFTWTSLINGHFLDYGIKSGLMQISTESRTATVFDDGDIMWSATTLPHIGLATARILSKPDATANKLLYIQSVAASQNDLVNSMSRAIGVQFQIKRIDSKVFIEEQLDKIKRDGSSHEATEELVSVEGITNAFWQEKPNFANDILEVPKTSLDDVVRDALR